MKSFVSRALPSENELKKMTIAELIKLRFFNLKGYKSQKATHISNLVDNELCAREDEFTEDDLVHLIEARPYKNKMTPSHKRVKGIGDRIGVLYNNVLRNLIPIDHPFRYRFVVPEFLDQENAVSETKAWLMGNSHNGPYWNDKTKALKEIFNQCNDREFNLIANQFVEGKSKDAAMLLEYDRLDPNLRAKIMRFTFIDFHNLPRGKTLVVDEDFINGIAPTRVVKVLSSLCYTVAYQRRQGKVKPKYGASDREVEIKVDEQKMKKLLFPYATDKSADVAEIMKNFYGEIDDV